MVVAFVDGAGYSNFEARRTVLLGKSAPLWRVSLFRGEHQVAAYRVYCLDGVNRVVRAEWIEADSDGGAVDIARTLLRECVKCEVWQGPRLIERFTAPGWPDPPDAA